MIPGITGLSDVSMISGDLLTQEESPDWREAKWEVNERKTSIGDVAKIILQLKLSLQEREQCLKTFGVQVLGVFRTSGGPL